jgi:ABC-2 type transport system permease protein
LNWRRELRLFLREGTFTVATVLTLVLFALGFWSGWHWLANLQSKADDGQAVVARQLSELRGALEQFEAGTLAELPRPDPRNPVAVDYVTNPYLVKQRGPLAITAVGESDVRPSVMRLGHPHDPTWHHEDIVSPPALAAGRMDLSFVVIVLLPLLAIGLTFRLLSSEREAGTLPLLKGQPAALGRVLLARTAIRYGALLLVAVATFVVGLAVTGSLPAVGWIVGWSITVAAYLGFWFALGLAVNTLGRSSGSNIVILTTVWVALVILVPALVNLMATAQHPAPSRAELLIEYRQIMEHQAPDEQLTAAYLDKHRDKWADPDTPPTSFRVSRLALQDFAREQVAGQMAAVADARSGRQSTVQRFQWMSPAIAAQNALLALAGTDAQAYDAFESSLAREYERRAAFFHPLALNDARLTSQSYDQIPAPGELPASGRLPAGSWLALLLALAAVALPLVRNLRTAG